VTITVCSVVVDVDKFIRACLSDLEARLQNPVQIRAGDGVFTLLSKLAECGVELRLEWPETKPATPAETAQGDAQEITDADIPF
jgi:hypothetical protein